MVRHMVAASNIVIICAIVLIPFCTLGQSIPPAFGLLSPSNISRAQEQLLCGINRDLRGPRLGANRNQGNAGWCASFTMADLISHRMGYRASARSVAVTHLRAINSFQNIRSGLVDYVVDGGYLPMELGEVQRGGGVCLESEEPSDIQLKTNESYEFNQNRLSAQRLTRQMVDQRLRCLRDANLSQNYLISESLIDLSDSVLRAALIARMEPRRCTRPQRVTGTFVNYSRPQSSSLQLLNVIDAQLNSGNIVGIGYTGNVLTNHTTTQRLNSHASSIVGRRFNPANGKCEYLVRNSWGSDCFDQRVRPPRPIYDSTFTCDRGNVWIPRETLINVTSEVGFIR